MSKVTILRERFATRCEICHQNDLFEGIQIVVKGVAALRFPCWQQVQQKQQKQKENPNK